MWKKIISKFAARLPTHWHRPTSSWTSCWLQYLSEGLDSRPVERKEEKKASSTSTPPRSHRLGKAVLGFWLLCLGFGSSLLDGCLQLLMVVDLQPRKRWLEGLQGSFWPGFLIRTCKISPCCCPQWPWSSLHWAWAEGLKLQTVAHGKTLMLTSTIPMCVCMFVCLCVCVFKFRVSIREHLASAASLDPSESVPFMHAQLTAALLTCLLAEMYHLIRLLMSKE